MGLDVKLIYPKPVKSICPHCGSSYEHEETLYSDNITHNLNEMAKEARIYDVVWNSNDLPLYARHVIETLSRGIKDMKNRPEYYKQFDTKNGWGTYEQFMPWLESYLNACIEHPSAKVKVWR